MIVCLIDVWTCLLCKIECWMNFLGSACEEQMRNPSNLAQASSSRLSENIRRLRLSLHEDSPRRAGVI